MRTLFSTLILSAVIVAAGLAAWHYSVTRDANETPDELAPFSSHARPQADRYLFDYANALQPFEEGVHEYLERIASRFHIEALIVTLRGTPATHGVQTLAVDLVNHWRVGAQHEGRGLLLLLVEDTKQVKLEVTNELEDVFTDAFSGYVEDLQLGPYYRDGDVGTGLIAVMEMLEQRAQIKYQGEYTPGQIVKADAQLLTGGAGATRDLTRYTPSGPEQDTGVTSGRGARSPEEAWETMLAKWAGEGEDIEIDVYTELTRLAMGAADKPPARTLEWLDHWREADYQVLKAGDHAVIWFGAIDGWENSPFLFCNPGDGWRFDIVHQRRLVVMAEAPKWQVSQGPYPYVALMHEAWQSTGKDLPIPAADRYRCRDDASIAARMLELRDAIAANPDDGAATMALLRLNVITGRRPNRVHPLIERAKQLAPNNAEPWKYSAIYNVNTFFQYRKALADIERYIALRAEDPFGYNVKGFLLYRLSKYRESIESLERAIELDPENGYAYMLMARDYTLLARKANALTKKRYRDRALAFRAKAARVAVPDGQRLAWLDGWLRRWGMVN